MAVKKSVPKRQCIGCGEMKEKRELIRILRTPEEEIILDATGKKNGRGAYLCHNDECLSRAFKSKGLDRAFKMAVPKEVYEKLREEFKALER